MLDANVVAKLVPILDDWLFKNESQYAKKLEPLAKKLPPMLTTVHMSLYRGMRVNTDFLEKAKGSGIKFDQPSSWTKNKDIAIKFAKEPAPNTVKFKDTVPIILEKKVPASLVTLDIHMFVSMLSGMMDLENLGLDPIAADSAFKEYEVLTKKGIVIKMNDISFIS